MRAHANLAYDVNANGGKARADTPAMKGKGCLGRRYILVINLAAYYDISESIPFLGKPSYIAARETQVSPRRTSIDVS